MSTEVETSLQACRESGALGEAIFKNFLGCARNDKAGRRRAAREQRTWFGGTGLAHGCPLGIISSDVS
jgi:hypothetical protein